MVDADFYPAAKPLPAFYIVCFCMVMLCVFSTPGNAAETAAPEIVPEFEIMPELVPKAETESDMTPKVTPPLRAEFTSTPAVAASPEVKQPLWHTWFQSLENIRDFSSQQYLGLARGMDRYLSGEPTVAMQNKSTVLLELKSTQYSGGEHANEVNVKARLRLPNAQKKINIIFTSDAKEDKTLQERVQGEATGNTPKQDDSLAGLEYVPDITKRKWEQNFSTGIKLRLPPVFFSRYKINKEWFLGYEWKSYFEQSFWYFDDRGFGATNEIDFAKALSKNDTLNIGTDVEFTDDDHTYHYDLIISNMHRITDISYVDYSIGAFGATQPTDQITSYYMGLSYRKVLHEDWLIFEVLPQISFPRYVGWKPTPSLTFGLKIYFSE